MVDTNGDGTYGGITGTAQVDTSGVQQQDTDCLVLFWRQKHLYTRGGCNDDNASSK
jgi:hypothetical protein